MTDQELQQLAREIAQSIATEMGVPIAFVQETQEIKFIPKVLKALLQTHCIVSREKVISEIKDAQKELNEPSKPMLKFTLGYVLGLLHNLFGSEVFEERSET